MGNPQTKFRSVVVSKTRFLKQQKIKHMDPLTIIIATGCVASLVGLAWLAGYQLGQASGEVSGLEQANRRVNGMLDAINTRRPKAAKNRRKAARKAVRA
jgi:hypothetical protein